MKSHLRRVKVSETCVLSEKDLILARAGLFDHDGHGLVICLMFCAKENASTALCMDEVNGNQTEE